MAGTGERRGWMAEPGGGPAAPWEPEYAPAGRRYVAAVVDGALGLLAGALVLSPVLAITEPSDGAQFALLLLGWLLYFVAFEARAGATPGKMMTGLRVRTMDGGAIGWVAAVVRNLLRPVDAFFLGAVGAIVAGSNRRRQRIGDLAARTVVVRD